MISYYDPRNFDPRFFKRKPRVNGGYQWAGLQPPANRFAVAAGSGLRYTCARVNERFDERKGKMLRSRVVFYVVDSNGKAQ